MTAVSRHRDRLRPIVAPALREAVVSLDAWIAYWGGEDKARRAWRRLGARLVRPGPRRPEPYWMYEPGIPEALRGLPGPIDPREVLRAEPSPAFHMTQAA
jgi:hypothetical protein